MNRTYRFLSACALLSLPSLAQADGTETLGPPSIPIAPGTGAILAGVGLIDAQPGSINFQVPSTVTIRQALLYWQGYSRTETGHGALDTISVDAGGGPVSVTGDRIGGPTRFFAAAWANTYRAEITSLVHGGANSIAVSGLDFSRLNNGAGVLVVVDDGQNLPGFQLVDGSDCAFFDFASPLDTTVAQVFGFAPAAVDRVAVLDLFVASVALEGDAGELGRPTIIDIQVFQGAASVAHYQVADRFDNSDGDEWDTYSSGSDPDFDLNVPALADSVRVQLLSADAANGNPFEGHLPASLVWVAGGFNVPQAPPPPGDDGCTPGYWKNHRDSWVMTGYATGDRFDQVFGVTAFGSATLLQVIGTGGGGLQALGRHAVAALLNASHPHVDFGLTEAQVLTMVHDAILSGNATVIEALKNRLDELNNEGCPLN